MVKLQCTGVSFVISFLTTVTLAKELSRARSRSGFLQHAAIYDSLSGSERWRRDVETEMTYECNGNTRLECTCLNCYAITSSSLCCDEVLDNQLILQSVILTLTNATRGTFTESSFESLFKRTVSQAVVDYCSLSSSDCSDAISSSGDDTKLDINDVNERSVVVFNVSSTDASLKITFFVLANADTVVQNDAVAVDAGLVQTALRNQTQFVTGLLGYTVEAIDILVEDGGESGLPIRAIIAGAILGFFLVLSCFVSAIKAVRDRKHIKARNAIKRDARRHRQLRDSIRKASPIRSKPGLSSDDIVTENGDVIIVAVPSNGDVRPASPMTSQVIQVMVHSDCNTQIANERQEPPQDNSATNHNNTRPTRTPRKNIPNGHLSDAAINGHAQTAADDKPVITDDSSSKVDTNEIQPVPATDTQPDEPSGESPGSRQLSVENGSIEAEKTVMDSKPGVINPAYDASDK